jgi:lysozyme
MQRVHPGQVTCAGFDVSHYQPDFDHAMAKVKDPLFCFIKATEGVSHVDPKFESHREAAKKRGLKVGAYHFFRPELSGVAQARHLASVVGGTLHAGDLPCVLDWEITGGAPNVTDVLGALEFLNAIEALTGRIPIVYGSPYFLASFQLNEHFMKFPLWIAEYSKLSPLVPPPWKQFAFWQISDKGVDQNIFNGSLGELKVLCGEAVVPEIVEG